MDRSAVPSSKVGDITSAADQTVQFDDETLGGEGNCALSFPWYNVNSREIKFKVAEHSFGSCE